MYDKNEEQNTSVGSENATNRNRWEFHEVEEPKSHLGWWVGGLVVAALAGLGWYFYPSIQQRWDQAGRVASVETAVTGLGQQLQQAQSKWTDLSGHLRQEVKGSISDLERRTNGQIGAENRHFQALNSALYTRVHDETQAQFHGVDSRLAQLETDRDATHGQVAQLQRNLAAARETISDQERELSSTRASVQANAAESRRQVASLNSQLAQDQQSLDTLNRRTESSRVDFEAAKNRRQEITSDVSLNVTGIDISHRRVSGYLWVLPEARAIWFHDQDAQSPMVFYGYKDGVRRELVLTDVTEKSVAGYLLTSETAPASPAPASAASTAAGGQ